MRDPDGPHPVRRIRVRLTPARTTVTVTRSPSPTSPAKPSGPSAKSTESASVSAGDEVGVRGHRRATSSEADTDHHDPVGDVQVGVAAGLLHHPDHVPGQALGGQLRA